MRMGSVSFWLLRKVAILLNMNVNIPSIFWDSGNRSEVQNCKYLINILRVLASYEPKIAKISILACNSANKPPFQNPTKSLFVHCSIDVKNAVTLFTATEHWTKRFFVGF